MARPVLLDLFSGAGGAAVGYHRAGFDVIGVDLEPQPFYPFAFHQADALTFPLDGFDAIHASPPCQAYSTQGNRARLPTPDLLEPMLARLRPLAVPWIVENVPGARRLMPNTVTLSGGMFGLGVHRVRHFVSNVLLLTPAPTPPPPGAVGVYGRAPDGRRVGSGSKGQRAARGLDQARAVMGIDWADWHGVKEAVPPAYTEYLGRQLLAYVGVC